MTLTLPAHLHGSPRVMSVAVCGCQVDDLVVAMTEKLRPQASRVARQLRMQGRQVDLLLQSKKMKQVFKVRHASQERERESRLWQGSAD